MAVTIIIFHSSQEMYEKAKKYEPDVIIADTRSTRIDCFGCCEQLKTDPGTKSIPVLFVASPEEKDRCMRAGCDGIVTQPVTGERLYHAVSSFMRVEERAMQRIPVVRKVRCSPHGTSACALYSKDLSPSGIFLKSREPFPIGSILDIDFALTGKGQKRLHVSGEVVRNVAYEKDSHLIAGMGIRFKNLEENDRISLRSLLGEIPSQEKGHP